MLRRLFAGLSLILGVILLISALGVAYARRNVDTLEYILVIQEGNLTGFFIGNLRPQIRMPEINIYRSHISPDGQWFLFSNYLMTNDQATDGIYRVSATENEAVILREGDSMPYLEQVTDDGWLIFWTHSINNDPQGKELLINFHRIGIDGQNHMNLINDSEALLTGMGDFTQLADARRELIFWGLNDVDYGLFRLSIDGAGLQTIPLSNPNDFHFYTLTPDGQSVILQGDRSQQANIYRIDINSDELWNLTNNSYWDDLWTISPDGHWLLFISYRDGGQDLYRVGVDGEGFLKLLEPPYSMLTFSSDGQRVIFNRREGNQSYIYEIGIDGEDLTLISRLPDAIDLMAFSHDSQWMIFDSFQNGNWLLFSLNLNSGEMLNLSEGVDSSYGLSSALSEDGQWLYFSAYRSIAQSFKPGFYRVGIDGQNLQQLMEQDAFYMATLEHPILPFRAGWIGGGGLALLILGLALSFAGWRPHISNKRLQET